MTYSPAWGTGGGGEATVGQATIPFADWKSEDTVTVTGQTEILSTSRINIAVFVDSDDVWIHGWYLAASDIVAGTGFTLRIRPDVGVFKGPVKVNWRWSS